MAITNPKKTFEKAISLLKKNEKDEAENLCREYLLHDSKDINFLSLLGTILLRKNDFEGAENYLRNVAKVAPAYPNIQEDLGTLLLNLGKFEEALLHLQQAIEQNPNKASAFTKLGGALKNLGRDEAGDAALKYAADLSPDQADLEKATMLFAKGKFREAEVVAKKIIEKNPRDVNAALLLGRIAINARAFSDAEEIFRRIVDIAPRFMLAWHDLSTALKEQDREEDAEQVLQSAISIDPDNAISHYYLAAIFAKLGKTEDSAKSYKHATELDPKLVGAHLGLGHVLKTLGDVDAGIAAYRQAIALRPNFGEIYFSLSNLKTFRFTDEEIEDMASRIDQENLDTDSVVHFAFSLGKAYEDNKDYDKAFEYYLRGNEEHRNLISYDPVQTELAHEKLKATFTQEFFENINISNVGNPDSSPIFIVGLPRSGSTLLEQILASHSQVQGTSELPDLGIVSQMISNKAKGRAFPGGILQMSNEEITHLGDEYIRRTKRYRSGTPFFTDKMPNNFAHVGLLSAILPNAKVIDARRHPLDSCVGSFKQHFAKGQTFTYDMFELGEFYLHYDNLMCHWNEVLPGKVLRVQYEDVVQNLDAQVERILDHCGLPFEQACVNFHETKRSVRTASSEQVRQPIYSGSVNTWQRFDSHLEPLKDILEPLLDANDPSVIVR